MYNPIVGHQFVHGAYCASTRNRYGTDALIANVKDVESGESTYKLYANRSFSFGLLNQLFVHMQKRKSVVLLMK